MIQQDLNILNIISQPIDVGRESVGLLFEQLEQGLANSSRKGIGLAAIQLGIPKRAFIIRHEKTSLSVWNPEVIEWGNEEVFHSEGCLSFASSFTRSVSRKLSLTFKNGDGRLYSLEDMEAIIFQHEFDHINGITLANKPMRVEKVGRNEACPCGSEKKYKKCCGNV